MDVEPAPNVYQAYGSNHLEEDNMADTSNNSNTNLNLQQQAMLNQFVSIAGCSFEQAFNLLSSSNWQYQVALNTFFDETSNFNKSKLTDNLRANNNNSLNINRLNSMSANAPSNTPVTPPNVDFLEKAFSKLNSSFQENPASSKQTFDYTRNVEINNFSQQSYLNNTSYECDMMQSNPVQMTNTHPPLPFSDKLYLESARFHYFNN